MFYPQKFTLLFRDDVIIPGFINIPVNNLINLLNGQWKYFSIPTFVVKNITAHLYISVFVHNINISPLVGCFVTMLEFSCKFFMALSWAFIRFESLYPFAGSLLTSRITCCRNIQIFGLVLSGGKKSDFLRSLFRELMDDSVANRLSKLS